MTESQTDSARPVDGSAENSAPSPIEAIANTIDNIRGRPSFKHPMSQDFLHLLDEMNQHIARMPSIQKGHEISKTNNCFAPPTRRRLMPFVRRSHPNFNDISKFYTFCDGLVLLDLGNGIFIRSKAQIAMNSEQMLPSRLASGPQILVIGTDGGGGAFALFEEPRPEIIFLNSDGVCGDEYNDIELPYRIVAPTFLDFLKRINEDLKAFLEQRPHWEYLT